MFNTFILKLILDSPQQHVNQEVELGVALLSCCSCSSFLVVTGLVGLTCLIVATVDTLLLYILQVSSVPSEVVNKWLLKHVGSRRQWNQRKPESVTGEQLHNGKRSVIIIMVKGYNQKGHVWMRTSNTIDIIEQQEESVQIQIHAYCCFSSPQTFSPPIPSHQNTARRTLWKNCWWWNARLVTNTWQ